MKKKLLIVSIPIIISIVGIIWFQIDWVRKTYSYESKTMNTLVDKSLQSALTQLELIQKDSISKLIIPRLHKLVDTVAIILTKEDSLKITLDNVEKNKALIVWARATYTIKRITIDLPKSYRDEFSKVEESSRKRQMTSSDAIMREMEKITEPYVKTKDSIYYAADSLKIAKLFLKNLSNHGINNVDDLIQFTFFKSPKTPNPNRLNLSALIKEYKPLGMNRYTDERRWVGVHFHNHQYILKKMLLGSVLSIILIAIMVTSFIYLIRTILKQKRLAEMKDDFIDNLTHEFKTPIATIAVAIEGLQSFNALNDKEKTDRYLTVSKNELGRLNNMVSNVLSLASQENRNIELSISEIDLMNMVQEVIGMEYFRAAKEVNFVLAIDHDANRIKVDPIHFKNVLTNLIDNAVKYSKETVEITITAKNQNNNVCISIKDNGIGISASELKYVFDKFYRVSTGNIYNVKGIGLGLSYVRSIIKAHNGTISVKSEINVGTEFSILIPLN